MKIIQIEANKNGGHANQNTDTNITVPTGWAVIPPDLETPNFPFGTLEAEEVNGVMTVTRWTAGEIPEPEPTLEPEPVTEYVTYAELAAAIREGVNSVE